MPYYCYVQNSLNITSIDSAYVDQIAGSHLSSNKNDDVIGLFISNKVVHYFPQGLENIFKDLRTIEISDSGLKVVHQSDLKPFSKLTELSLNNNQLEVIESGLFDFNLNLGLINLKNNKISFIDSRVFDNLVKLRFLSLESNICIDMKTEIGLTDVQNIIKAAKDQCDDPSYSNLNLKIHKLETESKSLNSDNLMDKLNNLEDEIKNSKFVNFFEQKLQVLQASQMKKSLEEVSTASIAISTISQPAPSKISTQLSEQIKLQSYTAVTDHQADNKDMKKRTRSEPESYQKMQKSETQCPSFNETLNGVKNGIKNAVMTCTGNFAGVHQKFTNLNDTVLDIHKTALNVKQSNEDIVARLKTLEDILDGLKTFSIKNIEQIEAKINTDLTTVTTSGINELEQKIDEKFQKFEEKIVKILKGMKIDEREKL